MAQYLTFNDLVSNNKVTKEMKKVLNYERFGLLPDEVASAVEEERRLGNYPNPLQPISSEEFQDFKKMISQPVYAGTEKGGEYIEQDISELSDMDIANIYYSLERAKDFVTDPGLYAEAGALIGGVVAPSMISGGAGLPASVAAFVSKYPRWGKTFAAFFGGAGGSAPFTDSYLEALGYGAREAAGEGAFQVLQKMFGGLFRKVFRGKEGKSLEAGAKSSQKIISDAGATLTPARLSKSPTIDMIEQLAEVSFFGAGPLREAGEKGVEISQEQLGKYFTDLYYPGTAERNFVQNFMNKASFENVDDLMKNFLLKGRDFYAGAIDGAYKNVNQLSKQYLRNNKVIDTNKMLAAFDRKIKAQGGDMADPSVQALRNYILNYAETGKGGVDFLTGKNIRSHFLSKTGYYTTSGTTPPSYLSKIAGEMASYTTKLMDDSIKQAVKLEKLTKEQGDELLGAYKSANKIYKEGKETFNTKFVAQLLLDETSGQTSKSSLDAVDNIYKTIVGAGDKPGRAREFFKLIDNATTKKTADGVPVLTKEGAEEIRKKIQGQYFTDVLKNSTEKGIVDPKKVLDFISGKKGPGAKVLNEIFYGNKDVLKNMEKYLNSMVLAQSKGIEKQKGSLFFTASQFGAATGLFTLTGFSPAGAALSLGILGGPAAIARMFSDAKFVDNLINLEIAKSGTNKYARSMVQVLNSLVSNNLVDPLLAKRFVDEGIVEDIFPEPDKVKKELKWYQGVQDKDLTSEENDNPAVLDVQAIFNKPSAPPGLLESLGIQTLDAAPVEEVSVASAPSGFQDPGLMAALDLGPISTASAPPSQSINPNTLASLESVGLPFFQAKDGGLASIEPKKFKKPQVVS